jgi:hypothetical protein
VNPTIRTQLLDQIRRESCIVGLPAALHTARAAIDDGRMVGLDIPEVMLALRTGDWRCLLPAAAECDRAPAGEIRAA